MLVLSSVLPLRGLDGSATYLRAIVEHLAAQGHTVEVRWLHGRGSPFRRLDLPAGVEVTAPGAVRIGPLLLRLRPWRTLLEHPARMLWLSRPATPVRRRYRQLRSRPGVDRTAARIPPFAQDLSAADLAEARATIADRDPDAVIANYAPMAAAFADLGRPRPRRIVVAHDVWHERLAELGHTAGQASIADSAGEARLLGLADVVAAIQWHDAETLRRMVPDTEVIVTPMPAIGTPSTARPVPGRCLYVGSQAPTNVEGLHWFLDEIWPTVQRSAPSATLHVCGTVSRSVDEVPNGVELVGRVVDLAPHYAEASVCVVPYLRGSGLKIKLIEAMTHGRATVATPAGVLGVEHVADEATLVRSSAEEFAAAVAAVLTDDSTRVALEAGARRAVERYFRPDVAMRSLTAAIDAGHGAPT